MTKKKKQRVSRIIVHSSDIKVIECPGLPNDVFYVVEKDPCKNCEKRLSCKTRRKK